MTARFKITARVLPSGKPFAVFGRDGWALTELIAAGEQGLTAISNPAPRWSAYVHALRSEHELTIETKTEAHGGKFPGHHARYVLRSRVEIISCSDDAQIARAA